MYVGATAVLAAAAVALLLVVHDGPLVDRLWLPLAVAGLIGLEHLFSTRLVRRGEQGETTTHEEAYIVALALLEPTPAVVLAVALGFTIGSFVARRTPVKAFFNVSSLTLAAALGMLVVEGLDGAPGSRGAVFAVAAGALVFEAVNRLSISGVLTLVGAGSFRERLADDAAARVFLFAANVGIGLLAGLAARDDLWVLPLGLAALVAVNYTFAGHGRAKAERQKLEEIVNASSEGILTLDRSGRITGWSNACAAITGFFAAEVLGTTFAQLWRLLQGERFEYPQNGAARRYLARVRTKEGETRWLVVARTRLPEGGDVLILHDDTARRSYEEVHAARLEDRMWSDLIASVSHELRTPLTSILGFTETLLTRPGLPPEERARYLGIIADQARRLGLIVEDLLSLRTLDEAAFKLHLEELDLRELLGEQAAAFERQLARHELRLELPDEPLVVRADRHRVGQVVGNLLSNAIKYSPGGGAVSVRAERENGRLVVYVQDEGVGIPPESHHEVFLPFVRLGADPGADGTGLGLAISRRIIRRHGGELDFESVPGSGSTFSFELPLEPA